MLGGSSGWLARPWFFAAVALLVLNDHVLKAAWPGWVTGKLSDFAGLLVVGTLASVLFGHRWGTVLAGLGFAALKTVPGVAEAAAPLLGGVTLRDASDLIALLVLPGLWVVLGRERPDQASRTRRGWQVLGLVAGLLATTATSQGPTDVVHGIGSLDGAFYATVPLSDGFGNKHLRSTDGGRTWIAVEKLPKGIQRVRIDQEGWLSACSTDAICYRARREQVSTHADFRLMVDRREPGGDWQRDAVLPDPHAHGLALDSVTGQVIVQSGQRTIRYRTDAGEWPEVNLVSQARPPQWQFDLARSWGGLGITVALLVLLSAFCWLIIPTTGMAVVAQLLNLLAAGAATMSLTSLGRTSAHLAWIAMVVVLLIPAIISRRASRPRRSDDPPRSTRGRLP